uniref:AAA_11 domain-containing protein n=1 Tax=Steinernema glaseri TaxID=37863 RepID=A0A1I7ZZG3_9BILA
MTALMATFYHFLECMLLCISPTNSAALTLARKKDLLMLQSISFEKASAQEVDKPWALQSKVRLANRVEKLLESGHEFNAAERKMLQGYKNERLKPGKRSYRETDVVALVTRLYTPRIICATASMAESFARKIGNKVQVLFVDEAGQTMNSDVAGMPNLQMGGLMDSAIQKALQRKCMDTVHLRTSYRSHPAVVRIISACTVL